MTYKDTYYICVYDVDAPGCRGIGECNLFAGLSADDTPDFEARLDEACRNGLERLPESAAIRFGAESALADLANGGQRQPFPSAWSRGDGEIPINGLIWMGSHQEMARRIEKKLAKGFRCLKLKIGGIRFEEETELLDYLRRRFPRDILEIRLDANGAFDRTNAMMRMEALARYDIHSIEQPVKAGQPELMSRICRECEIPVALDEELIGITPEGVKHQMLDYIKPRYIILKPALCGGFAEADSWIEAARTAGIGWWATSALESNIGLNAIAQWVARKLDGSKVLLPQGLGTGMLYTDNVVSPLRQVRDVLIYEKGSRWELPSQVWLTR